MRKLTWVLTWMGVWMAAAVLLAAALAAQGGQAAWLLLIPAAVLLALLLLITLGLRGSRGGLGAFLAGQFPPRQREVPRAVHSVLPGSGAEMAVEVSVDPAHPLGQIPPDYLSAAVDLSQVVGGRWWDPGAERIEMSSGSLRAPVFNFERPQLNRLVSALAPLVLRLGGSESDKVYYALDDNPGVPPGYESVLTRRQWERALAFCERNGCRLMFALNCGPSARRPDGSWNPANAEALMAHTASLGGRVDIWELGNELNVFFFVHGLRRHVEVSQYTRDLRALRRMMERYSPGALLAGQGSAFWPVLGEPLGYFFGYTREMLRQAGGLLDAALWHYYPQQSRRCPLGSRRAHPARLLDPANLDEAAHWAGQINRWRAQFAPGLPLWLGESGNAQCGGAPGLSETYLAGLWWLDELGLMARNQNQMVVRQSLTGMNYGLIDEDTLAPRPDYWNSLLWRRLVGAGVLPAAARGTDKVRVYAHSAADGAGICLLAINLDTTRSARLNLPQFAGCAAERYLLTAPDVLGGQVHLNGALLALEPNGQVPATPGAPALAGEGLVLPPLSTAFYVIRD